ncbi:MAG: hypothetical protein IKH52_06990 [Bacteroidaceae bacterium]|nr:hypothetical protein [Bacteroidaceae bacterium]MBR7027904.1 hypothetical protein [Bacteroidaceae bacterium]
MLVAIIVAIVVFTIYLITKEYNEDVRTNVTNYGGMQHKYDLIISKLQEGCKRQRITRDSAEFVHGNMTWRLDYISKSLEIRADGWLPPGKTIKKKWVFPHDMSQGEILKELESWAVYEFMKMV